MNRLKYERHSAQILPRLSYNTLAIKRKLEKIEFWNRQLVVELLYNASSEIKNIYQKLLVMSRK